MGCEELLCLKLDFYKDEGEDRDYCEKLIRHMTTVSVILILEE